MRVKTTAPMDNVKSLLINDGKMKGFGNALQIQLSLNLHNLMDFGMHKLFHVEVLLLCKWLEYAKNC